MLTLTDVGLQYRTPNGVVTAIAGVNGSIQAGEFVAVIGPSGCGKSTLLKLITGLMPPSTGQIWVAGMSPTQAQVQKSIGVVFQKPTLLPWRSILRNVEILQEVGRANQQQHAATRQRALEMLELVGLSGVAHRFPAQLSGGMQQRVAIARALTLDPPVLLMDEPFGALDAITRDSLNLELAHIAEKQSKTVLLVTHSITEAVLLADRVWLMSPQPGTFIAEVAIDLPRPRVPQTRRLPQFIDLVEQVEQLLGQAAQAHWPSRSQSRLNQEV